MENVSTECPEVNGAIAALEENVEEETMTQEEAEAAFEAWAKDHLADGCPVCCKEES
jgi:hypothetical protein